MQFCSEILLLTSNLTGAHFDIRRMTFIPVIVPQSVLLTLLISTQFSLTSLPNIWLIAWLFGLVYFQKHLGPTYKSVFLKTQFLPFLFCFCLHVSVTNRFHPPPPTLPRSYPFLFKDVYGLSLNKLRKQPTFRDDATSFPAKWRLRNAGLQKFHTTQIWVCFWFVEANFPGGSTNQKYYPDLGNDTSSVWNFCSLSSDVNFARN